MSRPAHAVAQLRGLWELPLFALSLLLAAGTLWLLLSPPALPLPAPQPPSVETAPPPPPPVPPASDPLREALAQARSGDPQGALSKLDALLGAAEEGADTRSIRSALIQVLELVGTPAALSRSADLARDLLPDAAGAERGALLLGLCRGELRRMDLDPSSKNLDVIQELSRSLAMARRELGQTPAADEAALLQGQALESLGHLQDAQQAYAAVGLSRPALKTAALLRTASCLRKRQPADLDGAYAAAKESLSLGLGRSPWTPEPVLSRELELLAQSLRESRDDGRALELETALTRLAADPLPHVIHAAEIHQRRAEQLEAAAEAEPARAAELQARARGHHAEAARAFLDPVTQGIQVPYASLLFQAATSFERAGETAAAVDALERFVVRYTDDGRFPQAVYRLGHLYRVLGLHDRALRLFDRTRGGMLHESGSVHYIPLALYEEGLCQALSRTPGSAERAAGTFRRILDLPDVFPESRTFQDTLLALATLEYETAQSAPAREHLEEWVERYPSDPRSARAFWMLGSLAWKERDWPAAAAGFRAILDRLHAAPTRGGELLGMSRTAGLLSAEALYRQGTERGDRSLLARARDQFLEARDLNLGTWRAPWALARMGDCERALGNPGEARTLYAQARWEYGQIGPASGPPPEGAAGIEDLVAWRAETAARLGGAP